MHETNWKINMDKQEKYDNYVLVRVYLKYLMVK